jgi:hypothetical protein
VLFCTVIAGLAAATLGSPLALDSDLLFGIGSVAVVGAWSWIGGENCGHRELVEEVRACHADLTDSRRQRDHLSEVLAAARIDIEDVSGPNGALTAAEYQTYLAGLLDDGSLSIDAYNRARAGLMLDPTTKET